MGDTLNDFTKLQLRCLKERLYHKLIYDGVDYESEIFKKGRNLSSLFNLLSDGYAINDKITISLTINEIVGFYADNGANFSQEDYDSIASRGIDKISEYIRDCRDGVVNAKRISFSIASMIETQLLMIDSFTPVEYIINEKNTIKYFNLFINNDGEKGRELLLSDSLTIFNTVEPNQRYPVILFFNSRCDRVGKFSTKHSVDFNNTLLENIQPLPNSIAIISKLGDVVVLDFFNKKCKVTVNGDRHEKIQSFFNMLFFEDENNSSSISANITFIVDKTVAPYNFYYYLITNPIMSKIFYVDEIVSAWCSKEKFYIFFKDYTDDLFTLNQITNDNNFRFSFVNDQKHSVSNTTINIEARDKDMLPSFLHKFSRLLSAFLQTDSDIKFIQPIKTDIYKKTLEELVGKGKKFFTCDSKIRGEDSEIPDGFRYCKVCPAGNQPIIIEEDEVQEWINYGRRPEQFPPREWGFEENLWIVCPKDLKPYITMNPNLQDLSGSIPELPCCIETDKERIPKGYTKASTRTGTSDAISDLGGIGALPEALESFLKRCFSNDKSHIFKKIGTSYNDNTLDSAIIALLFASSSFKPGVEFGVIMNQVRHVRELMSKLPIDIYKQELFDMTDKEIIDSILDHRTYIDPYLYYRGLELIFNVQIFVFVSNIGRDNPISSYEDEIEIPTLEIPRCRYTHIRNNNDKDIVLLYKNHGTVSRSFKDASCELIAATQGTGISVMKINNSNKLFNKYIYDLLDQSCHPYEWTVDNEIDITNNCYDSPFNTIDWSTYNFKNIGPPLGQIVNTHGKTDTLIFKNWILIIPPTQPIAFSNMGVYVDGIKNKPELNTIEEALEVFETSVIEKDCVWLEFNGKLKGIKIPIQNTEILRDGRRFTTANDLITRKNNLSILLQFIHWLWREEYNNGRFPVFTEWWEQHTVIEDKLIFDDVPSPKINCNNIMLPIGCNTFIERLREITKIWPFFFYRGKIHVSEGLYKRIRNNFNIEDIYSRGLTPEDIFGHYGKFIIDLTPTDEDYKRGNSIILSKDVHIIDWLNRNSSLVFKYESLINCMVIRNKLSNSLRNIKEQYLYEEKGGSNDGKIYLIQNSSVRSQPAHINALGIAYYWKIHKKNPGTNYINKDDIVKTQPYVVYSIRNDGVLVPSFHECGDRTDYLQIIRYEGEQKYGAMLPLL